MVGSCVTAKQGPGPIYDQIFIRTSNGQMSYSRLIVPIADLRNCVSRVLISVHERPIPNLFDDFPGAAGEFKSHG